MNLSIIILRQTLIMFIYIAIGWGMFKGRLISKEGSRSLAHLLLYVILPCVIIKSFCIERTPQNIGAILSSFAGAAVVLAIAMLIALFVFRKHPIDNFGAAFSNAGFMGIPLIVATLGESAVVYVAAMVALLNALQWTYGQWIISGDKKAISLNAVGKSPVVLALVAGCVIFFLQIPISEILFSCMGSIAVLNAPVAMIILGIYLGEIRFLEIFDDVRAWWCASVRLAVIPLITMVAFKVLFPGRFEMAQALLICASAPVGSNVAVYAQKLDKDYSYAVKIVCLSTVLSIVTIPLILLVFESWI